jgi:MFS family permease
MPSVGRALGGHAYFGWATAGYLMGSVLAGASSGVLALRFGLRSATMAAALLYTGGCALSAAAPEIFTFLTGRLLQGIGGGWLAGLSSVAIGLLFANRLLPRVYSSISSISSVWSVAVLVSPIADGRFLARRLLAVRRSGCGHGDRCEGYAADRRGRGRGDSRGMAATVLDRHWHRADRNRGFGGSFHPRGSG